MAALAEMYVGVLPDFTGFDAALKRGLADASREAERAGEQVTDAFVEAARQSDDALTDIGGPDVWTDLETEAEAAGESIQRSFSEAARQSDRELDSISTKGVGAFGGIAAAAGAAAVAAGGFAAVAGIGAAITQASDLNESINAVNVTFGESAAGIQALGETAAQSLGLSRNEFNSLAVGFASFAGTVAGPGGDVTKVLDDLTTRSADFASVMNLDVTEAADAFRSGLAGEAEPLKRFGIDLSEATIKSFAYANGIADAGTELTEAQKVQARYGAIMEQTNKTAGDFANTSDGLANGMRVLKAEAKDAAATIGTSLLPVAQEVVGSLGGIMDAVGPALAELGPILADALGPLIDALGPALTTVITAFSQVLGDVGGIFATLAPLIQPVVSLVTTLATALSGGLLRVFTALVPVFQVVGTFIGQLADTLGGILTQAIVALTPGLTVIGEVFAKVLSVVLPIIVDLFDRLGPVIELLAGLISGVLAAALPPLADALLAVVDALLPLIPLFFEIVDALLPPLTELLMMVLPLFTEVATILAGVLANGLSIVVEWVTKLIDWLMPLITMWLNFEKAILEKIIPVIRSIAEWFGRVATTVQEKVDAIVNFVLGIGGRIAGFVTGMWDGIKTGITTAKNWVGDRIDDVVDFVRKIPRRIGEFASGLFDGIKNAAKAAFNGVASIWNNTVGKLSFRVPGWVPGIGGAGFDVPDIPLMANGGFVTSPTILGAGEAGPEVVVPLTNRQRANELLDQAGLGRANSSPLMWVDKMFVAEPTDVDVMVGKLGFAVSMGRL